MSDPKLSDCPECGSASLRKQVTAAAFKLKGTGWYETDFKNSGKKPTKTDTTPSKERASAGNEKTNSKSDSSETAGAT